MATRKSMWVIFGILIISAWVLGSAIQVRAETMKCRVARVVTKDETMPVTDEEGHVLAMQISQGVAFFENGDIANFKAQAISDRATGTGRGSQAISYLYFTFEDGSSIIVRNEYRSITDSTGKISTKTVGEIIKGTGRYEGAKGTFSSTGKKLPSIKGEADKFFAEATIIYTLSK